MKYSVRYKWHRDAEWFETEYSNFSEAFNDRRTMVNGGYEASIIREIK